MATSQLEDGIPLTIDWLPHAQIAAFLGIHESQYRRDLSLLNTLGIISRDEYCKGYDRETVEILFRFRKLVQKKRRKQAAREILEWRENNGNN